MRKYIKPNGYLEVIAGPMFCGKTEELIRQVRRAAIAKKNIQVFKHKIDTRYGTDKKLFSHAGLSFQSDVISSAKQIHTKIHPKTEIVAIDEAQWFGTDLIPVIETLLKHGKKVLVAGLALTYDREPFEPIPTLMTMADKVTKLSAICAICGDEAVYHKRIISPTDVDPHIADPLFVGKIDSYQPRCRRCFGKP
jgi:thymidine kinase